MRKRIHLLNLLISSATYGAWLPVWWWFSGPDGGREIPVALQRSIFGFIGLIVITGAVSYAYDEYSFRSKFSDLSVQQKNLYSTMNQKHPRIERGKMVEVVKLPQSLREQYISSRVERFEEQDRQLKVQVAAKKAEQERKKNSPAERFSTCRFIAEQTIANKRDLRVYMRQICEPIMGASLPERWRTK